MEIELWIRFFNDPRLHCMSACEFQFIYKSVLVSFLNTVVSNLLSLVRVISTSRNVIFWFSSISCVDWMLVWQLFNFSKTNSIFEGSIYAWVSSTYLFQCTTCFLMDGNMASSKDIINVFANSGPNGDPMATPSIWI